MLKNIKKIFSFIYELIESLISILFMQEIIAIVYILLIGFFISYKVNNHNPSESLYSKYSLVPLKTEMIFLNDYVQYDKFTGIVEPYTKIPLYNLTSNFLQIAEIKCPNGSLFKQGELLIVFNTNYEVIDDYLRDQSENVNKMNAVENQSLSERSKLIKEKIEVLRAVNDNRNKVFFNKNLYAPFDGTIDLKDMTDGYFLKPNEQYGFLCNSNKVKIKLLLQRKQIEHLRKGDIVRLESENNLNKTNYGIVTSIGSVADPNSSLIPVTIVAKNTNHNNDNYKFDINSSITVYIKNKILPKTYICSESSIYKYQGKNYIFAVVETGQTVEQIKDIIEGQVPNRVKFLKEIKLCLLEVNILAQHYGICNVKFVNPKYIRSGLKIVKDCSGGIMLNKVVFYENENSEVKIQNNFLNNF